MASSVRPKQTLVMNTLKCKYKNCGQLFATRAELLSHTSVHQTLPNNESMIRIEYNCSECSYSVSNAALLQSHTETHHKSFIANNNNNNNNDHSKPNTSSVYNNNDHKIVLHCEYPECTASYTSKISLQNHYRVHRKSNTKRVLSAKSKQSVANNNHKTFNCILDDCPFTALSSDEVQNHIIRNHKEIEILDSDLWDDFTQNSDRDVKHDNFACFFPQCSYVGKANKGYKIHLLKKHGYRESIGGKKRQSFVANANTNQNIKIEPQIDDKSENTNSLMDTNGNVTIDNIKKENLSDVNDKTKFILVNNNEPIDKIEDKTGVNNTVTAPSETKVFHCYIDNCLYRGISSIGLRFHLLKTHQISQKTDKIRDTINDRKIQIIAPQPFNVNIKSENKFSRDVVTKVSANKFKCPHTNCRFTTKSYVGIRVHLVKKHKRIPRTMLENDAKSLGFKCYECKFIGTNTNSLRMHLCNKHNIRIKCNKYLDNTEIKESPIETSANIKKEDKLTTTIERVDSFEEVVSDNQLKQNYKYKCTFTECSYIGKTYNARRIHIFNQHKDERFTVDGYSPSGVSNNNNDDVYNFTDTEEKLLNASMVTSNKKFKCQLIGCNYVGLTLTALRIHTNHKHKRNKRKFVKRTVKRKSVTERNALVDDGVPINTNNKDKTSATNNNANLLFDDLIQKNMMSAKNEEINQSENQQSINNFDQNNINQIIENSLIGLNQYTGNSPQIGEQSSYQTTPIGGKKFKCQFPGCRFAGEDGVTLKTHVQNTHKSNQNSDGSVNCYNCYFPRCNFVGFDGVMLKKHIANQHNYHIEAVKSTHKLFKCKYPNCEYVGSTTKKGLRIHFKRNHGRSVAKNVKYRQLINRSLINTQRETINQKPIFANLTSAASPYQLFLEERRRQQIATNETSRKTLSFPSKNQIKFHCHYDDCSFSVEDIAVLRSHHSEKHKNEYNQ